MADAKQPGEDLTDLIDEFADRVTGLNDVDKDADALRAAVRERLVDDPLEKPAAGGLSYVRTGGDETTKAAEFEQRDVSTPSYSDAPGDGLATHR